MPRPAMFAIARDLARIYREVLQEPLPADLALFLKGLESEQPEPAKEDNQR